MGVDGAAGEVVEQIGFENDVLAAHVQRKQLQTRRKGVANPVRVALLTKDSYSRPRRPAHRMVLRFEEGKWNRSTCGDRCGPNQKISPMNAHAVPRKAARVS